MNSIELLQHIKNAPDFNGGDSRYKSASNSSVLYNEDIDKIEQELKVLDILKRGLNFRVDNHSVVITEKAHPIGYFLIWLNEEEKQAFNEVLTDNE